MKLLLLYSTQRKDLSQFIVSYDDDDYAVSVCVLTYRGVEKAFVVHRQIEFDLHALDGHDTKPHRDQVEHSYECTNKPTQMHTHTHMQQTNTHSHSEHRGKQRENPHQYQCSIWYVDTSILQQRSYFTRSVKCYRRWLPLMIYPRSLRVGEKGLELAKKVAIQSLQRMFYM